MLLRQPHLAAMTIVLSCAGILPAQEAADRAARVRALEQRLADLEARQTADARDLAATVDAVLRDAERRTALLAASSDVSAGYDNGFFIRAGDAFLVRPLAVFQFRGIADWRQDTAGGKSDEIETGFEIARLKFALAGYVFSRQFEYMFQWNTSSEGGGLDLEDAWARYIFADNFSIRAGQQKTPLHHEELVREQYQLAVERSLLNELLGGGFADYTQGVWLIYGGYQRDNPLNIEAGINDGFAQGNTDFRGRPEPLDDAAWTMPATGRPAPHSTDIGGTLRIEYKVMGNWNDYRDFTARGNREDLLVLGGGAGLAQLGDGDVWLATLDAQYETASGLSVYKAILVRNMNSEALGGASSRTDWGALVQIGYMLSSACEIFGRYDVTFLDEDVLFAGGGAEDTFHEITVGCNWYLGRDGSAGHRAKVTLDLTYLPAGAPARNTDLGALDASDGQAEWILRGQFQLII